MARDESGSEDFAWSYPKSYGAYGVRDGVKKQYHTIRNSPSRGRRRKYLNLITL
jgi:hypothetical protein